MMQLGDYVRCTKISPEVECQRQRSKVTEDKNEKLLSHPHWQCCVRRTLHAAADDTIASQPGGDRVTAVHADGGLRQWSSGSRSRQFYAGGKISACCLVEIHDKECTKTNCVSYL